MGAKRWGKKGAQQCLFTQLLGTFLALSSPLEALFSVDIAVKEIIFNIIFDHCLKNKYSGYNF